MTIKLVTLRTTQTLLADVSETDADVKLKKSAQVIVQNTQKGPMMGFAPFLEFSEEFLTGISISRDCILTITTPTRELENEYNKTFGSGIEIASVLPNM
jgi:hypothetical protein